MRAGRKAFAILASLAMTLMAFTALSGRASAESADLASSDATLSTGETTYGSGTAVTALPDGRVQVRYLPTFQRWDGAWRPMSAMNRSAGEWPYLAEETASEIRVRRLGEAFAQGKLSGAVYEFLPQGIKETFVLRLVLQEPVLSIPLTTTSSVVMGNGSVVLRDASGNETWRTTPFHAWDSADPPRIWDRPVSSLAYAEGTLQLRLDPDMLARATYPLYVDPTWTTNASMGWPGINYKENAMWDWGDHAFKLGWFSDNFDDGTKEVVWTTDSGSWAIAGGAAQLNQTTRIRTVIERGWNASHQAKITFTASGAAKMLFRWLDASNHYYLDISEADDIVRLRKVASGATTDLGSASKTIAVNQAYRVKVVEEGASFTVVWDGSVLLTATDPSPLAYPGDIQSSGFETYGRRTKIAVDDVRHWSGEIGYLGTNVRNAIPQAMRTIHSGSAYDWIDLRILSSSDNLTWSAYVPDYVKTGAKSKSSDEDAYYVQDADRKPYYLAQVDLRSTDDFSPALTEIAVIESSISGTSEHSQVLGHEPWQYYIGGMVNVVSGNLFLRSTDLSPPGKGWTLAFARAYNSLSTTSGPLGVGWTHAYNVYLTAGTGTVSFTDGDGSTHVFEDLGGGLYSSPRGLGGAKLVKNADATYTMSWKDGSKWTFSSAGKLSQMVDRNGNKLTLTYDGNGRLTKVADDSGVYLTFAYDANGRIVRVGDHNVTVTQKSPTAHSGSWSNGQNAFTSNNAYASTKTASATHRYANHGFTGPADAWITKVEACVEAHTAGDDDLGVKISTNSGSTWSSEQVVNLPSADPNALTCLDFTSYKTSWSWTDLPDLNFRVEVRYVKVGSQASYDYLDWIPVRVTTASRFVSYAYDASGNLVSVTDPLGNSDLYAYSGILEKYVDRVDKVLRFWKDGLGRIGEVFTGRYNRSSAATDWEFRTYRIAYGTGPWSIRNATVTDASGNVTWIEYDALAGRPTRIDGPLAASAAGCSCCGGGGSERWTVEWDGEHNPVSKRDGLNHETRTEYDWRGNTAWQFEGGQPAGGYRRLFMNTWQNRDNGTVFDTLLRAHDGYRSCINYPSCRIVTLYEYDWKGNLVKITDPLGNFTQNSYDSAGFVTKARDKRGFNMTFTYDSHGRRLTSTDPLDHTTEFGYDAVGRLANVTTAMGFTSRSAYNANGRVVSETDPLGHTTRYEYDGRGDRTAVVDANGNRTEYLVNVTWARVEKTIEATGDVTENVFDSLGRTVQITDPNGKSWKYEYDRFGRKTKETDPLGQPTRFFYDAAGNVVTRVDGSGRYTNYTYDRLNRLLEVFYQDGTGPWYQYDEENMFQEGYYYGPGPEFVRDTVYDALNRPTRVTSNFGTFSATLQYTYDENGNRRTMVYPDGLTATYGWDNDGRLASMQISDQGWTFAYDDDHRPTALRHPNGLQINYTYDAAGRLTSIQTVDTSNWTVLEAYTYTYDNVSNVQAQEQSNGTQLSYAYEEDSSLNATTYESGATSYYAYDRNGNRLYKNETDGRRTTYLYSDDSSLSRQTAQYGGETLFDVVYAYDRNGNLVSKVESPPGREPTVTGYDYDFEDRLTRVSANGAEQTSYAYGADGMRVRRTESGEATYFLDDPRDFNGFNDVLGEFNATGAMKARYVHGPGIDQPLAKFDKTEIAQGAWYYYHFDGRGSVTRLTRADKSTANRYVYDDFGRFRGKTEAIPNAYGFTGRETDVQGAIYLRARYYSPEEGRFQTRDPTGMRDGPNVYNFAGNNPASRGDPSGLSSVGSFAYVYYAFVLVTYAVIPSGPVNELCYDICVPVAYFLRIAQCGWYGYLACSILGFGTPIGFAICAAVIGAACTGTLLWLYGPEAFCEEACTPKDIYILIAALYIGARIGRYG